MKVIEEAYIPSRFCPKHGIIHQTRDDCPICYTPLSFTEIYRVKRVCSNCNEEFLASVEYFLNNSKCPTCSSELQLTTLQSSHHVVIDGVWDSQDRSKVIVEKNEQLRKRYAGYSYEQQSIKEKVNKMAKKKGIL
ncbi:MAG: hypothetical protein M0R03_03590 [Novosphingobium sp.]|nr:hypothetical protein [Novosphingobium sp.]